MIVKLVLINPEREGKFLLEFRDNTQGGLTQFEHSFGSQAYFTTDPFHLEIINATGPTEKSILLMNRTES